jgi:hypothetical protein
MIRCIRIQLSDFELSVDEQRSISNAVPATPHADPTLTRQADDEIERC